MKNSIIILITSFCFMGACVNFIYSRHSTSHVWIPTAASPTRILFLLILFFCHSLYSFMHYFIFSFPFRPVVLGWAPSRVWGASLTAPTRKGGCPHIPDSRSRKIIYLYIRCREGMFPPPKNPGNGNQNGKIPAVPKAWWRESGSRYSRSDFPGAGNRLSSIPGTRGDW